MPNSSPVLPLVAAYDFEESSGSTVADRSGNGHAGTIRGAQRTADGRHGKGLSFDGRNDWVRVADSQALDLTGAMTLEAWVRPTATGGWRGAVLKERSRRVAYGLYSHDDRGRASGRIRTTRELGTRGDARLPLDRWSHVAVTYDGNQLRMYVNGARRSSRTAGGSIASSSGALALGGHPGLGSWFKGTIDDVRIWSTALSAETIRTRVPSGEAARKRRASRRHR